MKLKLAMDLLFVEAPLIAICFVQDTCPDVELNDSGNTGMLIFDNLRDYCYCEILLICEGAGTGSLNRTEQ